ncbi:MAG TPA: hypothetical protein VFI22_06445 [Thermomicrobiales bacterium]|nr:hypothetical protein [Thermomicrobiales bacterium]
MEFRAHPAYSAPIQTTFDQPMDDAAVEALSATMRTWRPDQIADYEASVLDEVAALGGRPVSGFLAVELAALATVTPHAAG